MNTQQLAENFDSELATMKRRIGMLRNLRKQLLPIASKCSESPRYDMSVGIPYIYVYNREDLMHMLTLAPQWKKGKNDTKSITYYAQIATGIFLYVKAYDAALPPTCKVEKKTRLVEAVPAHEVTEEVLVCTGPVFNEPAATLQEVS